MLKCDPVIERDVTSLFLGCEICASSDVKQIVSDGRNQIKSVVELA